MGARREWFEVGWGLRRAVARLGREEERREAGYRSRKKRMGKMMRRKAAVVTRKLAAGRLTLRR